MFTPTPSNDNFQGHDSFMSLSPSSPSQSLIAPLSHSSPFLPGYLLGDHHLHHHSVLSPKIWSSGGGQGQAQKGALSSQMSISGGSAGLTRREAARGKVGGPPLKSLYSSPTALDGSLQHQIGTPGQNRTVSSPALRQTSTPAPPIAGLFQSPGLSRDSSQLAMNQSQVFPVSPAQADPFYTQGDLKSDDVLDETWVTVFGFPPGATSFILQQFSQYGTIIKHVVYAECNWMHIHYLSKIQAKKALSKNGKVYGGCMKIGVTSCIEKTIMEEKENQSMHSTQSADNTFRSGSELGDTALTQIRPLTAAYVASRGEYEVMRDAPTPKRDASIVSKLKEYMFGF
ncbi:unnamed protein product [Lymnaea stagnalis]|uniref:Nucleoporin NUP53 n=1 Tax=Lymnaea stagnalis TaxID=6523 RepID=A0AAV2I9M4_LYMST